jgi:luciferase family oxidoreductase group 1
MSHLKLSILDLATIYKGSHAVETLEQSTQVAQLADQLGYTRYWFAEHHNIESQISTAPDLLATHIGALTNRIRIGTGGIMLPNYSSLKVAENFSMLEALHKGRVDLGIGRAPGTDPRTSYALRGKKSPTEQELLEQVEDLLHFFARSFPDDHPYKTIKASPDPSLIPELFMLGSTTGGVNIATQKGLGFAFAGQINPEFAIPVLRMYRNNFKPSRFLKEPKGILSIIVIVAQTEEEAKYLAQPAQLQWVKIATGQIGARLGLEEANAYVYSVQEEIIKERTKNRFVIGSIEQVTDILHNLAKEAQVDELMIFDSYPNLESRLTAYQLLANAFELK